MSPTAKDALDRLWDLHGIGANPLIEAAAPIDTQAVSAFAAAAGPFIVEIGPGAGDATLAQAMADPITPVLAVDVHTPGLGTLLAALERESITNVYVTCGDAVEMFDALPPGALAGVRVFFPDPWPKARHRKRRLLQPEFIATLAHALMPGGFLHAATDWSDYADEIQAAVEAEPLLHNDFADFDGWAPTPYQRPITRFERTGMTKGHIVRDIYATRL